MLGVLGCAVGSSAFFVTDAGGIISFAVLGFPPTTVNGVACCRLISPIIQIPKGIEASSAATLMTRQPKIRRPLFEEEDDGDEKEMSVMAAMLVPHNLDYRLFFA